MKKWILAHKVISGIAIIGSLYGAYWYWAGRSSTNTETKYVVALAQKGTLIASVQGSGQVSALNQLDVKPKASGDVVSVNVSEGQSVKAGAVLAQLDAQTAEKAVRDAQANLESAKLSLAKLQQPTDALSLIQSQNALDKAKEAKQNALDTLSKDFDGGFSTVASTFLDLPSIISGLQDMLLTSNSALGGGGQWNIDYYASIAAQFDLAAYQYKTDASTKFQTARTAYNKAFQDYKAVSRSSDTATIEAVLDETYDTTKSMAEAVKSANDLIQFYKDKLTEHNVAYKAYADTNLASLNTYISQTSSHLSGLLGAITTIANDRTAITNADRTIAEDTESLAKLKAGTDPLDIQSAQLTITQRQNALLDAQETLANYTVRAPFDAIVAKVGIKKSDAVSSGTAAFTLITRQKLAEVSLNEIDAAKIKIGQKTTITFDAVPGLSISGEVSAIDSIGTVTQGVVTYTVTIGLDTQDDRVKPGMSISASIITNVKQDVLMVPNGAVKVQGTGRYVEVFDRKLAAPAATQASQGIASATAPRRQTIEIGLANDTNTEITAGLKEGDQVVTRTITAAATPSAPSLLGGGGARGLGR